MIYKNLTDQKYSGIPALRSTVLKQMTKSPLHAKYCMENGFIPSEDMILGRQLHSLILEPKLFKSKVLMLKEQMFKRSKAEKEAWDGLVAEWGEENIIQPKAQANLRGMQASLLSDPEISKILKLVTEVELTLTWEEGGVQCKAKLDMYSEPLKAVLDIKTTQDASRSGFQKTIAKFSYHLSAQHYLSGCWENNLEVDKFIFIAIEKAPPYACCLHVLGKESLKIAEIQREELLKTYKGCLAFDEWVGYPHNPEPIDIPFWASREIENEYGEKNDE